MSPSTQEIILRGATNRLRETMTLREGATLADVRSHIQEHWTVAKVGKFTNEPDTKNLLPITFFDNDGRPISEEEEAQQPAAHFDGDVRKSQPSEDLFGVFLSAVIGWAPPIWFSIKKHRYITTSTCWGFLRASIYVTIFLLDFSDAVVDLLLGFRTLSEGKEGRNDYGILLGVMTILARLLMGFYGVAYKRIAGSVKDDKDLETFTIVTYFFMELTVFMMEDGAAILFFANDASNDDREKDILKNTSLYLTMLCGFGLLLYNVSMCWHFCTFYNEYYACSLFCYLWVLVLAGSMVALLIKEVLLKNSADYTDDVPFSENESLRSLWTMTYGTGVFLCVFVSFVHILHFKEIEKKKKKRKHDEERMMTCPSCHGISVSLNRTD